MRSTIRAVILLLAAALTGSGGMAPPAESAPPGARAVPSGGYDRFFGVRGKQLTDFRAVDQSPPALMSDAIRFLHRRSDGSYFLVGRSEDCDTDWDENLRNDGCRDTVSLTLYDRRGLRVDRGGMPIRIGLAGYADTVPHPAASGLAYFYAHSILADPVTMMPGPTRPLPHSTLPDDSYLTPSGSVAILAEEDFRNENCLTYEQPHQPIRVARPCFRWRRNAIFGFDGNLALDENLLVASRAALQAFAGNDGVGSSCDHTYLSAIAVSADRIFLGGHREDRCAAGGVLRYVPFVIALRRDGTRDLGFGTGGSWSPGWPQGATQGGVVSDLQIDAAGNLLVMAGQWTSPGFTAVVLAVSSAGRTLPAFGTNGELRFADVQFDPGARNMKLVLAPGGRAYVFSRFGRQVARIDDVARGTRDLRYGPSGTGVYAAEADLVSQPAFAGSVRPPVLLHDVAPLCTNGVALIGTTLEAASRPVAIVLNAGGRRAADVRETSARRNGGLLFDSYAGMMPHTRVALGYAGLFDAVENRLLIGGSAGSEQDHSRSQPLFDFAISARHIRCAQVD